VVSEAQKKYNASEKGRACAARYRTSAHGAELRRELQKAYRETPRGKYGMQKQAARQRGIEFKLTFDEWWWLWEPHWGQRMVMARHKDQGAYELGNVRVTTQSDNMQERWDLRKEKQCGV